MAGPVMGPRVNLITLGVSNVQRARSFYERLGWKASKMSVESTAFFQLDTVVLSLFGEVAWNPHFILGGDGRVTLPK